jgi:MGT family glycosyltransferase
MARIGLVLAPFHGHVGPASRLSKVLVGRGHELVAWAPEVFRESLESAGAELRPVGAVGTGEPKAGQWSMVARLAAQTATDIEVAVEALHDERLDLVIHDCFLPVARIAAEWLGLPRVCSVPLYPPGIRREGPRREPPGREVIEQLLRSRDEIGRRWGVELGGLRDVTLNPGDVNVVYTTPDVAGAEPLDATWHWIGPLLEPLDAARSSRSNGRPLVYVALGSLFSNRPLVFRDILEGLADVEVDVLVGTGGRLSPEELEPIPENARVEAWPDGRGALRDASVTVTHAGINSVHEALAAAVPMVCLPQAADQWTWAKRVEELGVGDALHDPSPQDIRRAVTRLLELEEPQQRATALQAHLDEYPGAAIASTAIEAALDDRP